MSKQRSTLDGESSPTPPDRPVAAADPAAALVARALAILDEEKAAWLARQPARPGENLR